MHDDLLSIGALARAGDLPVTALRFYDAAGVLRPAHVDPATGYRRYTAAQIHTARLLARLRQAGLPVADLLAVLAHPDDAEAVLLAHRRRLQEDLAAAQAHLDAAAELLAEPAGCTVSGSELAAAVAATRHAVAADGDATWPGLGGLLLHLDGSNLRLVGCDRARLAVASVPVRARSGPSVRVVAPLSFLDHVLATAPLGDLRIVLGPGALEVGGARCEPLDGAYPDYEALLLTSGSRRTTVPRAELVEAVTRADDVVVVVRLDGGQVEVGAPGDGDALAFSRTFLLDAVRAARSEHLAVELDDERSALAVSPADRPDDVGLLMPIRID